MDRTQCRGREHEQGDLAMSEQGMVSKTTTNPRIRGSGISSCPSRTGGSQQHPAKGLAQGHGTQHCLWMPGTAKAQTLKNKTHHPSQMISQVMRSMHLVLSQADTV